MAIMNTGHVSLAHCAFQNGKLHQKISEGDIEKRVAKQ